MWEPKCLASLWVSSARYRDSVTFYLCTIFFCTEDFPLQEAYLSVSGTHNWLAQPLYRDVWLQISSVLDVFKELSTS
jgi:hypothetical protein